MGGLKREFWNLALSDNFCLFSLLVVAKGEGVHTESPFQARNAHLDA